MDAGKRIDFFMKAASDGMADADKSVPASGGGGTPDTKTDCKESVDEECDAPSKTDGEKKVDACTCPEGKCTCGEKTAASARDKARQFAADAGRPTATGIATGAGLGTLLAALGAMSRASDDGGSHSLLSNPLLLGAAGAGLGYVGGNLLGSVKTTNRHTGGGILPLLVDAAGVGGLMHLGGRFASEDNLARLTAARTSYNNLLNDAMVAFQRAGHSLDNFNRDFARVLPAETTSELLRQRTALTDAEDLVTGRNHRGGRGVAGAARDVARPAFGALRRLRSLTPFGKPGGAGTLLNQLSRHVVNGNLSGRLAALAALAGAGHLGYRFLSDD